MGTSDCGVLGVKLLYYDESLQHDGMLFEKFFRSGKRFVRQQSSGQGPPNLSELHRHPREWKPLQERVSMILAPTLSELAMCESSSR